MRTVIQRLVWSLLFASTALATGPSCAADDWPNKPVKIVVPFAPGAATDAIARLMGAKLGSLWNQSVIVENRPGASTIIGTEYVAKQPPDGYTLLLITPSFIINAAGTRKLPFDAVRDFAPVALFARTAMLLVVNPSLPVANVKELMALARQKPGELNFATSGFGSPNQLGLEIFKLYGAPMTAVPYTGAGPAVSALLGGHVQMMLTSIIAVQSLVKEGKLKPLGVTTPQRSPAMPEVPAISETIPGYDVENWWGIVAPAGTPAAVVEKIAADMRQVLADPDVKAKLANEGADPVGDTPAQFAAYIREDIAKWAKVVNETHAKIE